MTDHGNESGRYEDHPNSREELIEIFDEEYVEHTEWWQDQLNLVSDVQDDLLQAIDDRADVQVARRGVETDHSGRHTLKFRVTVAGEPWEGHEDE